MRYFFFGLLTFMLLALGTVSARGQGFPAGPRGLGSGSSNGGGQKGPLQLEQLELDTFPVYYRYASDPGQQYVFSDSLLDDLFHQFDPVRKRTLDYKNLGTPGSAHQPLVYTPRLRRGFDPGFHQYDLYVREAAALAFYNLQRPFTNLEFSRGSEQSNSNFSAQFSRNFSNKLNFSLDYRRLAQLGTPALFPNQQGRNTSLGVGFNAQSKDGRYQAFAVYADNKLEHDDNGGIAAEPTTGGAFFTPTSAAVNLRGAGTRYRHQELLYTHYFRPGAVDTLGNPIGKSLNILIGHQIGYRSSIYKFFDPSPASDAAYYGVFQTDNRGIRSYLRHDKLENQFRLIRVRMVEDRPSRLELNLTHVLHHIRQEPGDSTLQEVFIGGKWVFAPVAALRFDANAQLGVLGSAGDYQMEGRVMLKLGDWGTFSGRVLNQLYQPTLVQQQFYVTQQLLWQHDFRKTLETNIEAGLSMDKWKLDISGGYHLLNQAIYFDTSGFARQTGSAQAVAQLTLRKHVRVGKIHLDNQWTFQAVTGDILRVPTWFGKHSLYFSGKVFKVLDTRIGFDVRYTSAYFSDTYFPLTGQFMLQNQEEITFFPAIDAYFNLRVTRFRAFVKIENVGDTLFGGRLYYMVPGYPRPPVSGFRLGIKWRLSE